jgi:hypothetical protein
MTTEKKQVPESVGLVDIPVFADISAMLFCCD